MSNTGVNLPDIDIDLRDESISPFGGGGGGPRLPVGEYTMEIVNIEQTTSKKGTSQLKVTFKVLDEGEFLGVEIFNWYSLQTKANKEGGTPAIGRLKHLMMQVGCDLDKIRPAQLLGGRVIVGIIHEAGEAKMDAQGNLTPGPVYAKVVNEKAIAVEEEEAPPPPPPPATKKGSPAARRA